MSSHRKKSVLYPSTQPHPDDWVDETTEKSSLLLKPTASATQDNPSEVKSYGSALPLSPVSSLLLKEKVPEIINVTIQEPTKPQAKQWDSEDEFDHILPLHQILARYHTDATNGLSEEQVIINRERYGSNLLIPPPKKSNLRKFLGALVGGLNALLLASSILSFAIYCVQHFYTKDGNKEDLYLGVALIIVVHVSGLFSFYQEFKSNKIMESFKKMVPRKAHVFRNNGHRIEIDAEDLVIGDIVELKSGDLVPADVRIIQCQNFKVDNSGLTGESEPQKRSTECTHSDPMETKNLAFFSTNAVEGLAKGLVLRVGPKTLMGRLATLSSSVESGQSPIGIEMDRFIFIMTMRSFVIGIVFFGIAIFMGYKWLDAIFFIIGIMVANIPEGLSVTFTMILSLTAKRMAKKNCLVKHLQAVEALGSTSVICSDKTGTLTQNKMTVSHLWFNDEIFTAETSERRIGAMFDNEDPGFGPLSRVACLCSRAVFKPGQELVPTHDKAVEGDASEAAILKCMEDQFGDILLYRQQFPKVCEIPFNSTNKFQVSIHDMNDPNDKRYLLVMKGAPEKIISLCSTIQIHSEEFELDDTWKDRFEDVYATLGNYGERVLGFCDCRLPVDQFPPGQPVFDTEQPDEFLKLGFRFVGLISLVDPPKSNVPSAVSRCRSAGIKVVMVTGDHPLTAAAVARSVNIISPGNETREGLARLRNCPVEKVDPQEASVAVVTGTDLKDMSPAELQEVLRTHEEIVFARTSPEQKYIIVSAFQDLGYIVAATGDGVNDSPALKKADIGVAMGICGTEVSKETADLILMDDNFATIVTGVEEGRLIFDNLKKLILYTLGDNCAELYCVWVFIILRIPLPLGTIAMLLIMLGTDVMPAISIAHETAEADIMKLKPRDPKTQTLVTSQLLSYTYGQTSVMEFAAGMFSYFSVFANNGWFPLRMVGIEQEWDSEAINDLVDSYGQEWTYTARQNLKVTAQTASFIGIVLMQVANVICCKTRRMSIISKGMDNVNMNLGIVFEIALACFFIYTPHLNKGLMFHSLKFSQWLPSIPFAILLLVYDEVRRYFIRRSFESKGWVYQELYA